MNNAEKGSRLDWVDWTLAIAFFVVVGLIWWGLMARSDALIGFILPVLACVFSFGMGAAYVVELINAVKKKRREGK